MTKTVDYSFGHDEISQTTREYDAQGTVTSEETLVFGHDGHGAVRVLSDMAAAIVQFYAYEAYGQLLAIHNGAGLFLGTSASAALTSVLYSGEQFDSRIGQQYLRARWYDPTVGRFNRLDPFFGNLHDAQSLHKYLYVHGDPVNRIDPTGLAEITLGALLIGNTVRGILVAATAGAVLSEFSYFKNTPAHEWSVTGALGSIGKGAALGAIGGTTVGALWFIIQGLIQAIQVWRDPDSSGLQKALASVDILLGLGTAWLLKGQVKSVATEWKYLYSKQLIKAEVTTDLSTVRTWFNSQNGQPLKLGNRVFVRGEKMGDDISGVFQQGGDDTFVWLCDESVNNGDDLLMQTLLEEEIHLHRMKIYPDLAADSVGVGHEMIAKPEEAAVRPLVDDVFKMGKKYGWW